MAILATGWRRGATTLLAGVALALVSPGTGQALAEKDEVVVITGSGPQPAELTTRIGQRVTFINRTGRLVHLEFEGEPAGHRVEHRVFQVPGEIWAVFHRTGRHPYVVHEWSGKQVLFRGVVNVEAGRDEPAPGTCTGISVMEICLEP